MSRPPVRQRATQRGVDTLRSAFLQAGDRTLDKDLPSPAKRAARQHQCPDAASLS